MSSKFDLEETSDTPKSQNKTIRVQLLKNVDVFTGEKPEVPHKVFEVREKVPEKTYNPMVQNEVKNRRHGWLRNRPFLDDYVES